MNVEAAIREGRVVLVFGARALQDPEVLGELRRRGGIPAAVLTGDGPAPATALTAASVAPALQNGGVLCLIEADSADSLGLGVLGNLVGAAAQKPKLVIVAKAFNPFALPAPLRMLKFEHEKKKAKEFLFTLPVNESAAPVAVAAAPVADEPKKKASSAPKLTFVGREEELVAVAEWSNGPIVITGPAGVGKRWFTEKWLAGVTRLPDFSVDWGSEADSLYARIAAVGVERGDKRLADALQQPEHRPAPQALADLAVDTLKDAEVTLVIDHVEHVMRRDGSFHREGRLELLLRALLLGEYKARLIFLSTIRPRFYREGQGHGMKVLELGGLKGRELHLVFDAYRVDDFPREHFGEISQRIHGHPLAARLFAIAVRDAEDREELMAKKKFLEADSVTDLESVKRRIQKAVEQLTDEEREALGLLAHFRLPFSTADAEITRVKREVRLSLLGKGVLDQLPEDAKDRLFYVHPLVRTALDNRATSIYALLEALGEQYLERATKATGQQQLALAQEGNRLLFEAHRVRNRRKMPYPDHDPSVESIRGLIRSKKPHFELAEQRIAEVLKSDPANTETWLLKAELLIAKKADPELVTAALAEAEKHATPEVFHVEASLHQGGKSGRGKAAGALERGALAFPDNGRIRRRLAGIYVEQNRLEDAVRVLKEAMELEPMMPDTYGLLGEIYLHQGGARIADAEAALHEARRLDPENTLHMARLANLLIETAGEDEAKLQEAQTLLETAVTSDARNFMAHLTLARLIIDRNGDFERADWLLKKASKLDDRAALPLVERARMLVRQQLWIDAVTALDKAVRMEPSCHQAFYVRGEMLAAQGYIFPAVEEFRKALERSPKDSTVRPKYERAIVLCNELIASGQAIELQKQAEANGFAAPVVAGDAGAVRRDPGQTTKRRRRGGKGGAHEEAPSAEHAEGADAAATTDGAIEATATDTDAQGEPAEGGGPVDVHDADPAEAPVDAATADGESDAAPSTEGDSGAAAADDESAGS